MRSSNLFLNLAAILFGAIVILGEAFKLHFGFGKVSLTLVIIAFTVVLAFNNRLRFYKTFLDWVVYLFGFVFLLFAVIGVLAGNHIADVFEDLYPILSFVALFVVWRSFTAEEVVWLWKRIMLFATVAACKVILISLMPVEVLWDNNWQATKEPLPLNLFYRIILRGGDIFLSFALVNYLLLVQGKGASSLLRNILMISLFTFAVFISLSRSSYLAIAVALVLTLVLFRGYFSARKLGVFASTVTVLLLLLLPFVNTISLAANIFEARVEAFDANDIATDFRKEERSTVLRKASTVYYMGNGLGSYFYLDLSGSDKKDDRSIYTHDFNTWLVLKTGIIGLSLFYLIFFAASLNLFHSIKASEGDNAGKQLSLTPLGLFAGGVILVVISFLANKIGTISGSVFLALYAASSVNLKNHYESSF